MSQAPLLRLIGLDCVRNRIERPPGGAILAGHRACWTVPQWYRRLCVMVPHMPVDFVPCRLRLILVGAVKPFDAAAISTQALLTGVGAGHVARRVQRSGCTRGLADGQERRA